MRLFLCNLLRADFCEPLKTFTRSPGARARDIRRRCTRVGAHIRIRGAQHMLKCD